MLLVIMPSVVMPGVVLFIVILSVFMLNVIMLSVVMLSVVEPLKYIFLTNTLAYFVQPSSTKFYNSYAQLPNAR
jgi:hypothetical protein